MDKVAERTFVLDAIRANRRRVFLAVLLFFLVALIVVFLATLLLSPEDMRWRVEMLLILAISAGVTLLAFPLLYCLGLRSSKDVFTRLFPPATLASGDMRKLERAAEGVSLAAGLPGIGFRPVIMGGINCLSVGSDIDNAEILISREAVERLDRGEIEAMLAHEIYHILSGDIRLWALGTGISGAILLSQSMQRRNWLMPDLHDDPMVMQFNYHPVYGTLLHIIGGALSIILLPLWFAYFLAVIPKSRDHLADEHALLLTKSPEDVIGAIEKSDISRSRSSSWGGLFISHMLFNQPLDPRKGSARFFARSMNTHSSAMDRIERIRSMG
ncbi:MAG: M48 family metalloprotease [Actinobacteria bacterium]|nr:M48 family metalloprotease [Actinomycetota bacterium]